MKKLITKVLILMIGAGILYFIFPYSVDKKEEDRTSKHLHIALFTPTTHPALQEIEQGFKETIQKLSSQPYTFTTFNANGNRTLLRAQAEEMVMGAYDLLFTIGAVSSQTVAELLSKKNIKTPQVFCAVDGLSFAQSLTAINSSTTGSYVQVDYKQEMEMLYKIKPHIQNVLLVYDPTHGTGLEKYKKEIEEYIKKFGTTLHSVEIYQTNEIQQKVAALLPNMDVVLVLTDNTVVASIDALVALCNRYGVTLLASDLASGKRGAALAYGITEYESGSSAAQQANAILIHGNNPHDLSISALSNFRLEVNKDTMKFQNLEGDITKEMAHA